MAPLLSVLKGIYYGGTPGALRGPQALFDQAKKMKTKGVTLEKCKKFLASQPVYTRHRPARVNYKRNTVDANYPGHIVQIDIMDMQRLRDSNQHLYVFLSYDTFSKFLTGVPLLNRQPVSVQGALEATIEASPFPWEAIYWDKEGAFISRHIQAFLKERGIHNYTTKSKVKAPGVERSIRTLRTLLQRRFEVSNSIKWEKELPKIIASYNKRKHSTTKLPPNDLARNPLLLVSEAPRRPSKKYKLPAVGAHVRLNRLRGIFEKEASSTYTEEVFKVVRHKTSVPIPLIYVEDMAGDPILGGLYPEEYQQITWSGKKEIDKVIRERKPPGKPREFLVAYKGWPPKFNAWVNRRPAK
jgi:hypothetical protein